MIAIADFQEVLNVFYLKEVVKHQGSSYPQHFPGHPPSVLNVSKGIHFAFCLPLAFQFLKQIMTLEDVGIIQVCYLGGSVFDRTVAMLYNNLLLF